MAYSRPIRYLIKPENFDIQNLKFLPIRSTNTATTAAIRYTDPKTGKDGELVISTHKCRSPSGILKGWPYEMPVNSRDDTNIKEFKLGMNLTTRDSMDSPNEEEQALLDVLDSIRLSAVKFALKTENLKQLRECSPPQAMAIRQAEQDRKEDPANEKEHLLSIVKPLYINPVEKVIEDKSGGGQKTIKLPHKMYPKLDAFNKIATAKRNNTEIPKMDPRNPLGIWNFQTRICFPGGKFTSPVKCIDIPGDVVAAIRFRSIWFGNHGKKPYAMNIQHSCLNINFSPYHNFFGKPHENLLPPNNDPEELEVSEEVQEELGTEKILEEEELNLPPSLDFNDDTELDFNEKMEEEEPQPPPKKVQTRRRVVRAKK